MSGWGNAPGPCGSRCSSAVPLLPVSGLRLRVPLLPMPAFLKFTTCHASPHPTLTPTTPTRTDPDQPAPQQ